MFLNYPLQRDTLYYCLIVMFIRMPCIAIQNCHVYWDTLYYSSIVIFIMGQGLYYSSIGIFIWYTLYYSSIFVFIMGRPVLQFNCFTEHKITSVELNDCNRRQVFRILHTSWEEQIEWRVGRGRGVFIKKITMNSDICSEWDYFVNMISQYRS